MFPVVNTQVSGCTAFNSIINVRDHTFYVQDDDGVALKISYDNEEQEQVASPNIASVDISFDEIEAKVRQTGLDTESQNKLLQVCNKHRECFRKIPGRFRSYEYEIRMKNNEPFAMKSYPVPIKYREQVSHEIERMLGYGVIERASTPFINPLVAVAKKDNTVRLCLDARQINDRMLEDHDGPEEIDQVLRQCSNIGVMSSLDLHSSFWQVPLEKSSRKYTGFLHQGRTYQFTVVPFGLKVASAALNRAAESVLNGMQGRVIDFVDDWLIVSPDFDQHVRDLDELLCRINNEGVTINFSKFELMRKEIRFVGYILTPEGISIDEGKVDAIRRFPTPINTTQVKGFLGLINLHSRFTEKLAETSAPLIELTKKSTQWRWTDTEEQAFNSTKDLFCQSILLHHPMKDKPFILYTDASNIALGAALCQEPEEGDTRVIYLASRTLKGAEKNYYTTELELLSIVWALNKFRSYVYGSSIEIRTDHQALTYLRKKNILADMLSRIPSTTDTLQQQAVIYPVLTRRPDEEILRDLKKIKKYQAEDRQLQRILDKGGTDIILNEQGICMKTTKQGDKIYLPRVPLCSLAYEVHQLYAHIGARKVAAMITEDFYRPNITREIAKALKTCDSCQRNKTNTQTMQGLTRPIVPDGPNELLSIDFIGPFPAGIKDYRFILVTVDVFTKFVQLYPIVKATSHISFNRIIDDYVKRFGPIKRIQSDRGSQFTSKMWRKAMHNQGIEVIFSSIRHPQSNLVERYNKEIGRFLRTLAGQEHKTWSIWCDLIEEVINSTVNETTGYTPAELQTGQKPERIWTHIITTPKREIPYEEKLREAKENITKTGNRRAERHNTSAKITEFEVGDLVLVKALRVASSANQTVAKLLSLYEGPCKIIKRFSSASYELVNPNTGKSRGRYHITSLKRYFAGNGKAIE
ncbi:unnamed protein product [Trichogramma brassicae]|uniref:RNA-directed DNA polymerase n=1 Tax=Trichogramma brassicae TaxID=86971 RepID=A0A6H5IR15_9HYME|nr:unnamed protein product [Trichogramma brassicae]